MNSALQSILKLFDSSREIILLSYQIHTYDIYIQTECEGKIINTFSHTPEFCGTTDTL